MCVDFIVGNVSFVGFITFLVVFLRFGKDFYKEDEDKGDVNVTVEMVGFGFIPITASGPVDFNLRIVGGTLMSAPEGM